MVEAYGMSTRQAYRYLQEAQTQQEPLPIPQRKVAFTVKLSPAIIDEVHQQSRRYDQSLSQLVEQALQSYLHREGSSG